VVAIRGELRTRLAGLTAWRGELAFAGEVKRFRGRNTERPFGEGEDQLHRVTGSGLLVLRAPGVRFHVVELGGESAYLREGAVAGFEESISYENGRVAADEGGLELVHLRGHGRVVLRTAGAPLSLEVVPGSPLRVTAAALLGWSGAVAPRLVPAEGEAGPAVELTGEGRALVDPGPGEARP
jgi:uncharacterized protein (AIM24 family)